MFSDLVIVTLLSRFFVLLVLAVAPPLLTLFDSSPRLTPKNLLHSLVRWDSLHFLSIADHGYRFENNWAFFPGTPLLIHLFRFGSIWWLIALIILGWDSTRTLYNLTLNHFPQSSAFAKLVVLLSFLPSSPAVLFFAPYAEPFFTYLSYKGMLYSAKQEWLRATACFTIATAFRSNGTLLCIYLVWGLVAQPILNREKNILPRVLYCAALVSSVLSPFIYHNYSAYRLFCLSVDREEWCNNALPAIYTHTQAKYWDVGFLRYWSPAQVPNFIIATPSLSLLLTFSIYHLIGCVPMLLERFGVATITRSKTIRNLPRIGDIALIPYLIHTLAMCIILLFFSHTQIVLRLSAALPTTYWAAAWLIICDSNKKGHQWQWGKMWVWWSIAWGLTSLGLWIAFLPPA